MYANKILKSIQMSFCFSIEVQKSIKIRTLHFIAVYRVPFDVL